MSVEIMSFRKHQKNTLRGFANVRLTNIGLEIKDLTVHEKNGKRWLGLPARSYEKEDGTTGWARIVEFYDRKAWEQFQNAALEALQKHL